MIIHLFVDQNGRVEGTSSSDTGYSAEVDENHDVLKNPHVYKYENGNLIKDEAYQQQLIEEEQQQQSKPNKEDMNAIAILELAEQLSLMKGGV
ncbi:hypothetical protein GLV94_02885 [Virgibacillus halodenitrificans]|uniref:hypothetical protein n=1 Tax=Virgibacillus halodenitrificans TaxID=1482 RepID=UPI001369066D|nr:hypothetical protein [Virgibacillus halodenitrificans]MYL44579.1 hypothetical protein [Virgibacillus halodenitrificans]